MSDPVPIPDDSFDLIEVPATETPEIPIIPTPKEKKDFKTQANYNLRELEAEHHTLGLYKQKVVQQINLLQVEEHIIRKSLEILENKQLSFQEAQEMIAKLKENLLSQ